MDIRRNYKKMAYDYLREEIVSNRLPFGSPVLEQTVADALNISRTPIREAIKQLESDGLVVCYPFQGTFVTTVTHEDFVEICELRTLIEQYALEKSIDKFTEQELDTLKAAFLANRNDVSAYQKVDAEFHHMIVEKAERKRTKEIADSLDIQITRFRNAGRQRFGFRGEASLREHLELIELIRRHDLEQCKQKLGEHLNNVAEFFSAYVK